MIFALIIAALFATVVSTTTPAPKDVKHQERPNNGDRAR